MLLNTVIESFQTVRNRILKFYIRPPYKFYKLNICMPKIRCFAIASASRAETRFGFIGFDFYYYYFIF